jgi:hypothetical protein
VLLWLLAFLIGIYGGYFTAAQGVMLITDLWLLLHQDLGRPDWPETVPESPARRQQPENCLRRCSCRRRHVGN